MNQIKIGNYIANKRKEKKLTQEQLAEKIGVSNKTISKWECGRCMPDYGVIEVLCRELDINISELINGRDTEEEKKIDNESILQLVKEIDLVKIHNVEVDGILLILLSLVTYCISTLSFSQIQIVFLIIVSAVSVIGGLFAIIWSNIRKRKINK